MIAAAAVAVGTAAIVAGTEDQLGEPKDATAAMCGDGPWVVASPSLTRPMVTNRQDGGRGRGLRGRGSQTHAHARYARYEGAR